MRLHKSHLFALLVVAAGALLPSTASAGPPPGPPPPSTWTPVAMHLDSPRGVQFFNGRLVVAEAGHGGSACGTFQHTPICAGRTSKISWVNTATTTTSTLVGGLFSAVEMHGPPGPPPPPGSPIEALGTSGLSVAGSSLLAILEVFPETFYDPSFVCATSECRADLAAARRQAGHLISVNRRGSWRSVASVGSYDYHFTGNPDNVQPGQEHDANPHGVLATRGGALVVDAGSNTLDFVSSGGKISVVDYFYYPHPGMFPSDAVPTCVVKTDDALWVADLDGQLFREHGGSHTAVPNDYTKHVTGCTAGNNNDIYFVNMWTTDGFPPSPMTGNVVRYKTDEGTWSVVGTPLNWPNMITLGPDNNLYVSADSICPSTGTAMPCPQGGTVMRMAAPSDDNNNGGDDGGGDHDGGNHGGNNGPSEH